MQNWALQLRQSKAGIITFIQSTSFGRKNSNKASSSSNVDSVVGCSLKLFRSLARDCLATLPKGNVKAEIRDYIVCYEHCNCNRFLISCGRCSQLSSLLQRSFPEDVGVTNRRPSWDSELISRVEMRLLVCVTRGPSRELYKTVSTVYFTLGILRKDL